MTNIRSTWFSFIQRGFALYFLTSFVACFGVIFGSVYVVKPHQMRSDVICAFANWDGRHYKRIVEEGYQYDSTRASRVAFFPAFPMTGRVAFAAFGLRAEIALLLVSHCSLALSFVFMFAYVDARLGGDPDGACLYTILAFGLWPTSFFFRLAYSESLFVLTCILAVYGLEKRWPLWVVCAIAGFATGSRPVGVALAPLVCLAIWKHHQTRIELLGKLLVLLPLSCWGVLCYAMWQYFEFGDPFCFSRTQSHWRIRTPVGLREKLDALAIFEPIWSVYSPASSCFGGGGGSEPVIWFSLRFANPIFFVASAFLVGVGFWHRWLNANEVVLSSGLLLIPYVTRSHEMCFCSFGRFSAVVFPVYFVMGQLLWRIPMWARTCVLVFCGCYLAVYSALFGAGYPLF